MGARHLLLGQWALALLLTGFLSPTLAVDSDRVIVRLKGGAPAVEHNRVEREAIAARLSSRTGELMRPLRVMGDGAQVMQLFRRVAKGRILDLAAATAGDPDVIEVLPDRIFFPALTPTDPLFARQWYPAILLAAAID